MKSIFLSASIPLKDRDPKYYNSTDVIAIRDAVLALVEVCLKNNIRIVWGGHPAITPLVYQSIKQQKIGNDSMNYHELEKSFIQKYIRLFQSDWYSGKFPKDNDFFENITFTQSGRDVLTSLEIMRDSMLSSEDFVAGVFIGGMEGVEKEYRLFSQKHPNAICIPVASTGAAAAIIYNTYKQIRHFDRDLLCNYAYNSLFCKYLIDNI